MTRRLALAIIALGACVTPTALPPAPRVKVSVFITSQLRGALAPCGCSENMRGGIARTAAQIERGREGVDGVLVFDSGETLFSAQAIPDEAVPQQELKARTLAAVLQRVGLSATVPGPLDDARGTEFRRSLGLPELEREGLMLFAVKGRSVALVTTADRVKAQVLAKRARDQGAAFVVVFLEQPFDNALPGLSNELAGADLVIAARAKDELSLESNRVIGGVTRLVQLQGKGRSLLRVDLVLTGGARPEWVASSAERDRELSLLDERVELLRAQVNEPMLNDELKALRKAKLEELIVRRTTLAETPLPAPLDRSTAALRVIPIEATLPGLPVVEQLVTTYDRDVGKLNVKWAQEHGHDCAPPSDQEPGFVGNDACQSCHLPAFATYAATKHPKAYLALESVGKTFHLDCVSCHVTGWQKPGGVCRIDHVSGRAEVGCEACHGPGSVHVKQPLNTNIKLDPTGATCVGCHDRENSPQFDLPTYLSKIVGPGHGQRPPK